MCIPRPQTDPVFVNPGRGPSRAELIASPAAPDTNAGENARSRRRARARSKGRSSTVLTGPAGVTEQANIGRKTLLGA